MKNDFLTIPDAPNYEINSQLFVRNKITGFIFAPKGRHRLTLWHNGKSIGRNLTSFRRQAVCANSDVSWFPVHSLNCKYELNRNGVLRNSITKKIIKLNSHHLFQVTIDCKTFSVSRKMLMWEVLGSEVKQINFKIPVSITNKERRQYFSFDSLVACARFIAPKINYSVSTIQHKLAKRCTDIFGWRIYYDSLTNLLNSKMTVTKALKGAF